MPTQNFFLGACLILISELFLVLSGMSIKQVSATMPTEMIVFARNIFALVLLLPWLMRNGLSAVHTRVPGLHLLRALIGVSAMACLYYSWSALPLAQAAVLKQTAPFFIPLFGVLWLGERINWVVKLAIAVGFAGVFVITNPQEGSFNIAVLIAVAGAAFSGLAKVNVRKLRATDSAAGIVFYFALFSSFIAVIPALLSWQTPNLHELFWLVSIAVNSTIAQLLFSRAYGLAPAGSLGPFTYASVALASLFGWLLWDEVLALNAWFGIALICGAGVLTMFSGRLARGNQYRTF